MRVYQRALHSSEGEANVAEELWGSCAFLGNVVDGFGKSVTEVVRIAELGLTSEFG
jgi:hypothetical protein